MNDRQTLPELCRHCGNTGIQHVVARFSDLEQLEQPDGWSWDEGWEHELLQCPVCSAVQLRKYYWHSAAMDSEDGPQVSFEWLYPSEPEVPLGLPSELERSFRSALKVRSDPNAYGVLLRRLLQEVCIDAGVSPDLKLFEQLKQLAVSGQVPDKLVDVADGIRKLGNVGAHPNLGELSPETVPVLENLTRAVLDYVYSAPALALKAQEALERVRAKREQGNS